MEIATTILFKFKIRKIIPKQITLKMLIKKTFKYYLFVIINNFFYNSQLIIYINVFHKFKTIRILIKPYMIFRMAPEMKGKK